MLKRVYLEITNVCNLSCAFCPGTKRPPHFLTREDYRVHKLLSCIRTGDVMSENSRFSVPNDEYCLKSTLEMNELFDSDEVLAPIRADYVGKNIPTSREERIHVQIPPFEETACVTIEKQ